MAARKKIRRAEAQLGFDALFIEGGLLSPEWLTRVAQLSAGSQTEADYRIEKGLNLRDEIGRYWRIAQAYWRDFAVGRTRSTDLRGVAESFVSALLRKSFEFESLHTVAPITLGDRVFPIGHAALEGRVPVVIASAGMGLDKLPESAGEGGRRRSAFGLAQEYLNAQEGALWGIVSDGCTLRILRDNASLTRPAWIEADLERIFTEERYADFAALWLLLHETRFGKPGQPVTDCALETWRNAGREEGTRAREFLRRGVEEALLALGQGFLAHPSNQALRNALQDGSLTTRELFQQLLRLVYRIIFLLTVEERGLLHPEGVPEATRKLYEEGYSLRQLRERSTRRSAHDRFSDRWEAMKIVFRGLAQGESALGLPALVGLFARYQCTSLDAARLENRALMLAMFRLSWLRNESGLARVNWRDMGPEELGSVYESLLELVPQITDQGRRFAFATGGETKGNARKTTGSYYTPDSLVQVLLDGALEPVVKDTLAANPSDPVEALLSLSVVDPACGSGHFLLGAARRLAVHVARIRANGTPSASQYRVALRDVVRRCIYGVDLNPMAVELCKVSLWMEALEPGLPLTFLDSHIQQGNSLLGTTPELMGKGIPDAAWEPIEGDDKKIASALKKRNKKAAGGQRGLDFGSAPGDDENKVVVREAKALEGASDETSEALARKESRWGALLESPEFRHQKLVADAWCAAFMWPKQPGELAEVAPTNEVWRQLRDAQGKPVALLERTVSALMEQYQFFHWHLQFPQIFTKGGFDVVLGNPPWDTLSPDRREFFSKYRGGMRSLSPEEQEAVIEKFLADECIASAWENYQRSLLALVHFLKNSGRFTLYAPGNLGKGDFNVYRSFTELALKQLRLGGCSALILPGGVYGGANASAIRKFMLDECELLHLWGLSNSERGWFADVDMSRFAAYAARRGGRTAKFSVQFGLMGPQDLSVPRVTLDAEHIRTTAEDTYAIPDVRTAADVTVSAKMLARHPAFGDLSTGPPLRHYQRELDMGNDRDRFVTDHQGFPLYEGRMVGQFDYRAKTYDSGHGNSSIWIERPFGDPAKKIVPQWYVLPSKIPEKLGDRCSRYRVCFRDVAQPRDVRSLIAALIPAGVICGDKVPTLDFGWDHDWAYLPWLAVANSFVMDWMARSKLSSPKMSFTLVDSLPFPRPTLKDSWVQRVAPLVLRLSCTGPEMTAFWNRMADLNLCVHVPPHETPRHALIHESERMIARAELDAIVALEVYALSHDELADVLDTFPVVRRRDEEMFGEFYTKRIILEIYDEMAEAIRNGKPYPTRLNPPPEDPRMAPPPREGGKVIPLPVRPTVLPSPSIVPAASVVPDLATLADGAWTRPHSMERGEIKAALLAVLKVYGVPMDRRQVRLAALFSLEPHLLLPMLDNAEKNQWVRVIGDDAKKDTDAPIDTISQEWGAVISGLRGRGKLVEDLSQNTWAIGVGTESTEPVGWPEGRANFVVNVVRRLQASTQADAIILKLPINVQEWLANAV